MILSFGNKLTQHLFEGVSSKETIRFPKSLQATTIRKITQLDTATQLSTLNIPPSNRLEAMQGNLKGYHSIRINDQWRICFQWTVDGIQNVQIIDYH